MVPGFSWASWLLLKGPREGKEKKKIIVASRPVCPNKTIKHVAWAIWGCSRGVGRKNTSSAVDKY